MAEQVTLLKKGVKQIPNTTSAAVADVARRQALSATLTSLIEKEALGYPAFATTLDYAAGTVVFYDRKLYRFTADHAAGAWNAAEAEEVGIKDILASANEASVEALTAALEQGDLVPALAGNLDNWASRDALSAEDTFTDTVRTTAGDTSIDSDHPARLASIVPVTDFSASAMRLTGFNLLRDAVQVGSGWYFLVPELTFGSFGTANENNGVLFTDSEGQNLKPTVRFKPLASGVPTSATDGTAATYTDSNGLRFFTTSGPGYLIVSGITRSATCAHIGWSRRYNEYIAVDDEADAGSQVELTAIINAVHDFGLLLRATDRTGTVADDISFADGKATWTRRVGRIQPSWTTTEETNSEGEGTGQYTHTATISGMKAGAIVECGSLSFSQDATSISYTDELAAATTDYVKYELATPVSGTVSIATDMKVEDWGLEVLQGAEGTAEVTMAYAQNYPDAVAGMVNGGVQKRTAALEEQIAALKKVTAEMGNMAEGYVRVAGSSDPALSYRHYQYDTQHDFSQRSAFEAYYPCLVGNNLTEEGTVGKILHVLKKLGACTVTAADIAEGSVPDGSAVGDAIWEATDGTLHRIDGSEGDVMVTNTVTVYQIAGHREVEGVVYDVFLRSLTPFVWQGYESEEITPFGQSPDYTVAHSDDGTMVMHSVYNPAWNGSYTAPVGVKGKYVISEDASGNLTETFDEEQTLLGGAGGLHTTNLSLYTGEQYAMNMQGGAATVPYYNLTARAAELLWAGIVSEGGTFDAHKAALMGSGFSANDPATQAAHWNEDASEARNGVRLVDKEGNLKYYALSGKTQTTLGIGTADTYVGQMVNDWRSPWHILEAYRAVSYAIQKGVGELEWFAFEGNKYKWRSIDGFRGPQQGEATCVVWKMMSGQLTDAATDPTDHETSLEGHRIDFLFSTTLWHGITTQVSPSWWTSGLIFTEDENGDYEAYMERDQARLIKSESGDKDVDAQFQFETAYQHVGTYANGSGYRKNYSDEAFMLSNTDANKTGAGLHTYVGAYNYFTGTKAAAGKLSARGFRRGVGAFDSSLSPLFVNANSAPSGSYSGFGFGTCVRIVSES